jgi:hypothetical protein
LQFIGKSYGSGAIKVEPRSLEKLSLPEHLVNQMELKFNNKLFDLCEIAMRQKPVQLLNLKQLEALPTKALLGRLKRLHQCEESFESSDCDESEVASNTIQFKNTLQWQCAYKELNEVLSEREHLPKGNELKRRKRDHEGACRALSNALNKHAP